MLSPTALDSNHVLDPQSEGLPVFGSNQGDDFIAFTIGSPDTIASTGSFTGGEGGISSTIIAVTSQSVQATKAAAKNTGKIGSLKLGIGAAQLG
jgi:hypothetical protein